MCSTNTNALEKRIKEVLEKAYERYGEKSTAQVKVENQKFEIWINSEDPYLGKKYWDFFEELSKELKKIFFKEGFLCSSEWFYNYNILKFEKP